MLSAAVAGSIFASPNVSQIRHAISIVSKGSSQGTLLVVKNYTGDVLHFGLAAEQHHAAADHSGSADVRIVVVGDDVAVGRTQGGLVGRRYVKISPTTKR
jgi:dihydroxyacetone kinase